MRKALKLAYKLAYGLGTLSLIASVVVGATLATPSAALAGDGEAPLLHNCGGNHDVTGETVIGVFVKAGTACFGEFTSNGTYEDSCEATEASECTQVVANNCYTVSGIGSSSVSVSRTGGAHGSICQAISHLEYLYGEEETETPTTEVPTTEVPTTEVPTTEVPTTEVPTTEVPTTEVPNYQYSITDPCEDGCDVQNLTSTVSNTGIAIPSSVTINWEVHYNGGAAFDSGSHTTGLAVSGSFDINFATQGDGTYTVHVWLDDDEANQIVEQCSLSCSETETPPGETETPPGETPTPPDETETPGPPESTPEAEVFIPVTGFSEIEGGQSSSAYLQDAGFGLLGLGLVLQGLSLRFTKKED